MLKAAATFLTLTLAASAQQAKPLATLDDMQLRGSFYQIARLPDKAEKHCVSNAVEEIARGDKLNSLALVDSCKTKSSYAEVRNINAHRQDKKIADGRFKTPALFPFTHKYWIIAIANDYAWFVAGSPNHEGLWIYARTPALDDPTLQQIKSLAISNGYNLSKLQTQPQDASAAQGKPVIGQ